MDVKYAFLHKVYRLHKAMYGLKQALGPGTLSLMQLRRGWVSLKVHWSIDCMLEVLGIAGCL
jgi:hypothetical protein